MTGTIPNGNPMAAQTVPIFYDYWFMSYRILSDLRTDVRLQFVGKALLHFALSSNWKAWHHLATTFTLMGRLGAKPDNFGKTPALLSGAPEQVECLRESTDLLVQYADDA